MKFKSPKGDYDNIKHGDVIVFTYQFSYMTDHYLRDAPVNQPCFVLSAVRPYVHYLYLTVVFNGKLLQITIYDANSAYVRKIA